MNLKYKINFKKAMKKLKSTIDFDFIQMKLICFFKRNALQKRT